ncbi:MAG: hypothetical protein KatS3mg054_0441 [Chloroflexus sp.]|nr:MAG: hypothetical protein KatS3mg054_0206 [Chloroflexus sp.]GIV86412.1 MAG: hypothetical protein KatS3mg054_0441 [Chloroflexus sp.]
MRLYRVYRALKGYSIVPGFLFRPVTWEAPYYLALVSAHECADDIYLSEKFGASIKLDEVPMSDAGVSDVGVVVYRGDIVRNSRYLVLEPQRNDDPTVAVVVYCVYDIMHGEEQNGLFILREGEEVRLWFHVEQRGYTLCNMQGKLHLQAAP